MNKRVGWILLRKNVYPALKDKKLWVFVTIDDALAECKSKDTVKSVTQTDVDQINKRYI